MQRFRAKTFVSCFAVLPVIHPSLFRSYLKNSFGSFIPAIACQNACRGLAQRDVGRLDGRRHARPLLGIFVLCCRQHQRGLFGLHVGQREPAEQREPGQCLIRALRPSICKELFLSFYTKGSSSWSISWLNVRR